MKKIKKHAVCTKVEVHGEELATVTFKNRGYSIFRKIKGKWYIASIKIKDRYVSLLKEKPLLEGYTFIINGFRQSLSRMKFENEAHLHLLKWKNVIEWKIGFVDKKYLIPVGI